MNIGTALNVGYTIANVISFLTGNYPKLGKKIKEAQKLGYDVEKIVKTFSDMTPEQIKKFENSKELDSSNPWISASERQREGSAAVKGKEYLKKGAKIAGAVAIPLAAYGLQRYLNKGVYPSEIIQGDPELPAPDEQLQLEQMPPEDQTITPNTPPPQPINQAPLPQTQTPPPDPMSPSPAVGQQMQMQAQSPVNSAMQPTTPTDIAQASQAIPDQMQQQPEAMIQQAPQQLPIFEQLLGGVDPSTLEPAKQEQLKFLSQISDQLQSKGKTINDPEFIKLGKKIKDIVKGKPGMLVEESARFNAGQEQKQANVKPLDMQETEQPKEKPMAKGAQVITPSGDIATVEDHPGKAAKVMIDGKPKVFDADELTPVPDNHEEIGTLYQKLIDKIPEGQKSRVYDAIGYDPVRNAIKYTYHDGKSYIIDDVPEEIAKEIANSGFLAKTSGGNYMGFYYKGNPSIGAGMDVLIKDLQSKRGGKGKEYSYKFEELYSQHRLPKNILKEKKEREKQREREEKAKKKRSTP